MENNKSGFIDKFTAIAGKIGSQRHLAAIRDGFVTMMPLLIVGSLVTLINNIPIAAEAVEGEKAVLKDVLAEIPALSWITTLNGNVWWGTFGMLSLFAVVAISYYLAKSYKADSLSASVISLATFMCSVPQLASVAIDGEETAFWGFLNYKYLNAMGLFVAIIVALVATEIFVRLSRTKKLIIKMPEGVPPAVSRSFAALLPGVLTVLIVTLVTVLIELAASLNVFDLITETLTKPFASMSGSLGFGIIVILVSHILWIFGIHGSNILEGILQPLNVIAINNNQELLKVGATSGFTIFNKSFLDAFVYMGGSGLGLGLVIAILIASKSKKDRMVGRLGLAPGLFNINEPVLFGLPIVLNPVYAIPFILAPLASLCIAYGATVIGFLPVVRAVIPWTTPPILSGLFATGFSWQGPVVQIINLAVGVLIYMPFVRIANRVEIKREQEAIGMSK